MQTRFEGEQKFTPSAKQRSCSKSGAAAGAEHPCWPPPLACVYGLVEAPRSYPFGSSGLLAYGDDKRHVAHRAWEDESGFFVYVLWPSRSAFACFERPILFHE